MRIKIVNRSELFRIIVLVLEKYMLCVLAVIIRLFIQNLLPWEVET